MDGQVKQGFGLLKRVSRYILRSWNDLGLAGIGFDDIFLGKLSRLIFENPIIGKILYALSLYGDNFIFNVFFGGTVFTFIYAIVNGDPVIQTSPYSLYPTGGW